MTTGQAIVDRFTFLHLLSGIAVGMAGLQFWAWVLLHGLYEVWENTKLGQQMIQQIPFWPAHPESTRNSAGDQAAAIIGWRVGLFIRDRITTS